VVEPAGQKARGGHGKTIAILAAIGAAAGVGAAFGLRKNDSSSTTPASTTPTPVPIGLTPGAGVIGAPPR
jgi:hypothetical protein